MAHPREGTGLGEELLARLRTRVVQHLDRDASVEPVVVGREHGAHAAAAQGMQHGVATDRRGVPAEHALADLGPRDLVAQARVVDGGRLWGAARGRHERRVVETRIWSGRHRQRGCADGHAGRVMFGAPV